MKKRKILYLFPLAALILSGCTIPDAFDAAKEWTGEKIYFPIRDFVNKLFGKETPEEKDEKPADDQKPSGGDQGGQEGGGDQGGQEGGGDQGGGGEEQTSKYGTLAHPLSVSEAIALIDEEGTTAEDIYITGTVATNAAYASQYGQLDVVLAEGDQWIKVFRASTFPDGFDVEHVTANSMKGMTVVASGSGTTYNETYELDADCTIHSVTGEAVQPGTVDNYGTAQNPLTVSEAIEVIKVQDPTTAPIFVTGTVTSNTAWNSSKKNVDNIFITDGENELEIFRASTFPDGFAKEQIVLDSLKGKIVTATGTGMYYYEGDLYELSAGCEVLSIETPQVTITKVDVLSDDEVVAGYTINLSAKVSPDNAPQDVVWSITDGNEHAELQGENNNVLKGLSAGKVTVRATAKDTEVYGEKEITVTAPSKVYVESITTTPEAVEMEMGDDAFALALTVSPQGVEEEINWAVKEGYEEIISLTDDHKIEALKAGKAELRIEGAESHEGVDVKVSVYNECETVQAVYEAGLGGDTGVHTFKGVVTAMAGNSYYVQENGYGMYVYNCAVADIAVGKVVQTTASITKYNGLVETDSKKDRSGIAYWEGQLPTPIEITGLDSIGEANILANAADAVLKTKASKDWADNYAPVHVFTIGQSDISVKFDKYGFNEEKAAIINGAVAGDVFDLSNVVTSINNSDKQLVFAGNSTIVKTASAPEKIIESIGDITAPTEVAQGGTVTASQITVAVHYTDGTDGTATITSVSVDTTDAGKVTGDIVIEGWNETLHFEITVVAPVAGETTVTFNAQELIADPNASYTGGSVKLTSHAIDEVITISVSGGSNSGKIYKSDDYGFQIRLYNSSTDKGVLTVTAASGYEITAASAMSADGTSSWYVEPAKTDMTIADDGSSASISGKITVYSVTVTYRAK